MQVKEQVTHRACEEYLSIKEVLKITILYLILIRGVVSSGLWIVMGNIQISIGEQYASILMQLTMFLQQVITILLIGNYLKKRKNYSQKNCFNLSYQMIIYVVIFGIGVMGAIHGIFLFLEGVLPLDRLEFFWNWPGEPTDLLEFPKEEIFIGVCIIGPIVEEWIYRGYILKGLSRGYNKVTAILVSSLLFGFMHMNMGQFIGGFIMASISGLLYLRYESLGGCILLHGLCNMLTFMDDIPLAFCIIGIPASVVAVYILWKEMRKKDYCANSKTVADSIPINQIPK